MIQNKKLIREYKSLSDKSPKQRKRKRDIEEELKIFALRESVFISAGTKVTLSLIQTLGEGSIDKFIEVQKKWALVKKDYPLQSWIDTANIIKGFEKEYGILLHYDERSDEIFISHKE